MSFFLVSTVIDQRQTKWLVLILTEMSLGGTIDCFSITGMVVEPTWKGNWVFKKSQQIISSSNMKDMIGSLQEANSIPLDYETTDLVSPSTLPASDGELSQALITHFLNFAKNDNLGQISMLWQDYAAEKGADCKECVDLAKLHSVAVDFPKTGIPATVPESLRLPAQKPRSHWRKKKNAPSAHCTSIIGRLFDKVVERLDRQDGNNDLTALAGRNTDKFGQVLGSLHSSSQLHKSLQEVYDPAIPIHLGVDNIAKLLAFAKDHRDAYEEDLFALMNKYKLRSEGEVMTGCIRKYHKMHKQHQHEFAEHVRRWSEELRSYHRKVFFQTVRDFVHEQLENVSSLSGTSFDNGPDDPPGEDPEELQELSRVEQASTSLLRHAIVEGYGMRARTTAFRLAAAYYMSTYSPEQRWNEGKPESLILFSFPWLVVDVIAAGLLDDPSYQPPIAVVEFSLEGTDSPSDTI